MVKVDSCFHNDIVARLATAMAGGRVVLAQATYQALLKENIATQNDNPLQWLRGDIQT